MAFIRDVDSDKHVYANPVASFLQQVGKASRRYLSKLVKELKTKVQARRGCKKDKPPSHMQRSPRPKGRQYPPPEPCNHKFHPVRDRLYRQRTEGPELTSPHRRSQRNRSYESISHRDTLTILQATNPGLPTIPATADGQSTGARTAITKAIKQIRPNDATKDSLYPGRPRLSFKDIPEVLMPGSIAARTEQLGLPFCAANMHAREMQDKDELWLSTIPEELPGSPLSSFTPRSSQDQDSVSSVAFHPTQPVKSQISERQKFNSQGSHLAVNAPILGGRPFRSTRMKFPPRIPSLYFRPGSPFAGGNFPWQ